ncbi:MAG: saccharopine dehydrogenase NADP-binding domain-containing protein [Candidatus Cloacimonetes bacterium]|nr:saccharopine dehydrogenase NADP-binding domain-containing protein [Candidatus Cloacimonadota bacterium]
MKNIIVLGCGMVGRAIALDLSLSNSIIGVDVSPENLIRLAGVSNIRTVRADLSRDTEISRLISGSDLVINALPGHLGFAVLRQVIGSNKDIIDISFFSEDPFQLDGLAREKGVTAIVDCGVAPGMSNMILGYHHKRMKITSFHCLVGGLPVDRSWPYQYKAPFSPVDVLEEYLRPARFKINGKMIIKPALSDSELVELENVGTLEAFNTDGLRSLLCTVDIPEMIEKTLRYPGHIEYIKVLRDSGFLSSEPVNIRGNLVRPIDLTASLLFPLWQLEDNEREFTVMQINIRGYENGDNVEYQYDLLDRYDAASGITSMARTTGYTCTAVADLLLRHVYSRKGISPPEFIGFQEGCLEQVLAYQEKKNITYNVTRKGSKC